MKRHPGKLRRKCPECGKRALYVVYADTDPDGLPVFAVECPTSCGFGTTVYVEPAYFEQLGNRRKFARILRREANRLLDALDVRRKKGLEYAARIEREDATLEAFKSLRGNDMVEGYPCSGK